MDQGFKLLSPGGKILYDYLLTSPVGNAAGYYKLTKAQLKADLCREDDESDSGFNVDDEIFFKKEILPQLTDQDKLWKYDSKTNQVLILNYLKYNRCGSERQIKGMIQQIGPLDQCELHLDFFFQAQKFLDGETLFRNADKATKIYLRALSDSILQDLEATAFMKAKATVISNFIDI